MQRAKSKFRVTIVFLITVFFTSLLKCNTLAIQTEQDVIKKLEETEKAKSAEVIVRPRVEYKGEGLRDPFQKPIADVTPPGGEVRIPEVTKKLPPALTVQGLIWGGRFPQAIINNKVVKAGDNVEGALVISIDKDGVILFFEGLQYNLRSPKAQDGSY